MPDNHTAHRQVFWKKTGGNSQRVVFWEPPIVYNDPPRDIPASFRFDPANPDGWRCRSCGRGSIRCDTPMQGGGAYPGIWHIGCWNSMMHGKPNVQNLMINND